MGRESNAFSELMEKYQAVLAENSRLQGEVSSLKARLEMLTPSTSHAEGPATAAEAEQCGGQPVGRDSDGGINSKSDVADKVRLFMSLFSGRDAVRWENRKGSSGYSPCCHNEWKPGVCAKPKGKCAACHHKAYAPFDGKVVEDHLRGEIVAGIYPMLPDDTCRFLAMALCGTSRN